MLIDTSQNGNYFTASYADKDGSVKLKTFDIRETNGIGCYDYEVCDENDPEVEPVLRHFKNDLRIKKIPAKKFDFDEKREFLLKQIPEEDRNLIFSKYNPEVFMVDIEIDIGEEGDVFPSPQLAEFPIDSIQITNEKLHTLSLTKHLKAEQSDEMIASIKANINSHYKEIGIDSFLKGKELEYSHIVFDTEKELVDFFWKLVNEKLHCVGFWNGNRFDVPYLWNRCPKIGVDISKGSPTGEISEFNFWPKHRYVFDYMVLIQDWAWDLEDRTQFGLNHISQQLIGAGKYAYEGSYKDLYHGDIIEYLTYGAIDTIAMQLIHLKRKYTQSQNAMIYYCKASIFDNSQVTALIHALVWDELYSQNKINAYPHVKQVKEKYPGGYVKTPPRKFAMFLVLNDFSALYPRVMQSFNFSFENLVDHVKTEIEKKEYLEKGYVVSVNGNVYKNDKDYSLKILETKLLGERYQYKDLQQEVYLEVMQAFETEMTKRGLKIPKHN